MSRQRKNASENSEDIKKSIDLLFEEVTAVRRHQENLLALVEEVKTLRLQIEAKNKRIVDLEWRVNELEQYSRMNDLVITGLPIKPRSYARAVVGDNGDEPELESRLVEQQVESFLQSKGVELNLDHIEACHPLPRKSSSKPVVIVRFINRKNKIALLKQGRKLKGTNVYLNEHLTKKNAEIAWKARDLKKHHKIQHTWVTNCKILIKLNGSAEDAKILTVRHLEELDKYQ